MHIHTDLKKFYNKHSLHRMKKQESKIGTKPQTLVILISYRLTSLLLSHNLFLFYQSITFLQITHPIFYNTLGPVTVKIDGEDLGVENGVVIQMEIERRSDAFSAGAMDISRCNAQEEKVAVKDAVEAEVDRTVTREVGIDLTMPTEEAWTAVMVMSEVAVDVSETKEDKDLILMNVADLEIVGVAMVADAINMSLPRMEVDSGIEVDHLREANFLIKAEEAETYRHIPPTTTAEEPIEVRVPTSMAMHTEAATETLTKEKVAPHLITEVSLEEEGNMIAPDPQDQDTQATEARVVALTATEEVRVQSPTRTAVRITKTTKAAVPTMTTMPTAMTITMQMETKRPRSKRVPELTTTSMKLTMAITIPRKKSRITERHH